MTAFSKKNLKGFTLIEIIVVMAIISIVSGMVIVSLTDSRVKRELETNAREFVGVVREAQNYALTGKIITGASIPVTAVPCYFGVSWRSDLDNYKISYIYKNSDTDTCDVNGSSYSVATYAMKNGAEISSDGSLFFRLPHANFSGNTSVEFTKKGIIHKVCIFSDGRISDRPGGASCL